jgi:hypothetical protein
LYGVYPFMMPWPPSFPALNGGHDHDQWSCRFVFSERDGILFQLRPMCLWCISVVLMWF